MKKLFTFAPPFLIAVLSSMRNAGIAQLVEHDLAKVGVAGSSPVSRSQNPDPVPIETGMTKGIFL